MLRTLIFAVTCSAAAAADLYSNCAQTERTGVLPLTADVKITSSITGGDGTCFKVAGTLEGNPVEGAIFDVSHPAVAAYYSIRQSGNPRLSHRLHRLRKRHLPPRPARPDSPISTAPTFTMGNDSSWPGCGPRSC